MFQPRLHLATSICQVHSPKLFIRIILSLWIVAVASSNSSFRPIHLNGAGSTKESVQSLQWNKNPTHGIRYSQRGNQIQSTNTVHRKIISTEESDESDETNNEGSNDDITVVVPLNFARGENIDDAIYNEGEDSSISKTRPFGTDDIENQTNSWLYATVAVIPIAGYFVYRRKQRSLRREYRTHQILQQHVEAFDLSFRDEDDDVELSNF